jgi:hypothetical protein
MCGASGATGKPYKEVATKSRLRGRDVVSWFQALLEWQKVHALSGLEPQVARSRNHHPVNA